MSSNVGKWVLLGCLCATTCMGAGRHYLLNGTTNYSRFFPRRVGAPEINMAPGCEMEVTRYLEDCGNVALVVYEDYPGTNFVTLTLPIASRWQSNSYTVLGWLNSGGPVFTASTVWTAVYDPVEPFWNGLMLGLAAAFASAVAIFFFRGAKAGFGSFMGRGEDV